MHDIEPYHKWRRYYIASEDKKSIFYGQQYSEFTFQNKIYNYFIHPQWDSIGSQTLYVKPIFVDYEEGYALIEMIGEWNDCLNNDVMFLKRKLMDNLIDNGVHKHILLCDNVLNFHSSDDAYYEEWWDDIKEDNGWVVFLNTREHIIYEMEQLRLQYYAHLGYNFTEIDWRKANPKIVFHQICQMLSNQIKQVTY